MLHESINSELDYTFVGVEVFSLYRDIVLHNPVVHMGIEVVLSAAYITFHNLKAMAETSV